MESAGGFTPAASIGCSDQWRNQWRTRGVFLRDETKLETNLRELGLAVSGGGDSVALLHLAVAAGLPVRVVTVEHGLRAEAATEAAEVARVCAGLGVAHEILRWRWDGRGNVQDAARRGRRAVMAEWARDAGVGVVALGHTRDDVAETLVMRLARGAGVDGLAAMAGVWDEGGVQWLRPLLGFGRVELRAYLSGIGAAWVEDPSNDNLRFDRVRVRKALAVLGPLGLTVERLAEVAGHLAAASEALEVMGDVAAAAVLRADRGAVWLDIGALARQPVEVQRRLILRVIGWIGGAGYAPRGAAVTRLLGQVLAGKPGVLAGVRVGVTKAGVLAYREAKAVAGLVSTPDQLWDRRWQVSGPVPEGADVRMLGAGIALCPDWRAAGLPRAALMAGPALWLQDRLIAAPLAGLAPEFSLIPLSGAAALHQCAIEH